MKFLIIIAGMPATGKTTYGNKIAKELQLPFFSKDKFKEVIYDSVINNDEFEYEEKRKIGITSYSVLYTICEVMMKASSNFIIESNFTNESAIKINELIKKYNYKSVVIKFDTDIKILHKRFLDREKTIERHPGLIADGKFNDFATFNKISSKSKNFRLEGVEEILIDTSDFSKVDFEKIVEEIKNKIS